MFYRMSPTFGWDYPPIIPPYKNIHITQEKKANKMNLTIPRKKKNKEAIKKSEC